MTIDDANIYSEVMTNYIEGGLADFALPPYIFKDLISATFFLAASKDRLDGICEKFLNRPLNRGAGDEFEAASDRVIMTCSTFPISEAPQARVGFTQYCEVALMFSVYDRKRDEWSWFAPVLYLDGPAAGDEEWQPALPIAIGRELYGLAKRRAEISLDTDDYTGSLSTIGFASPGQPVDVREVLSIHLASEVEATQLGRRLRAAEHDLIDSVLCKPAAETKPAASPFDIRGDAATEALRKQLKGLQARCGEEKVAARQAASLPDEEREPPLSAPDFMKKIWGDDPYARVKPHSKAKPPAGDDLLHKLGLPGKRSARPAKKKASKTTAGKQGQGANASGNTVPKQAYQDQLDFHLLGFRQLRDPQNFARADVQQVIRTQLSFDRLPWPVIRDYHIEINEQSDFSNVLGLRSQRIDATEVFEYRRAQARFGDTSTIVT